MQCRLVIRDENVLEMMEAIPYGSVTKRLKEIIRKHIRANQTKPKQFSETQLRELFQNFRTKMQTLEDTTRGAPDRYHLLCEFYETAIQTLFSSLGRCYQAPDQSTADACLAELADENFVKELFDRLFPPVNQIHFESDEYE